MKKKIETIDYEWLIKPTGDPFADIKEPIIKKIEGNIFSLKLIKTK
jgi:hypothetical protein